MARVKNKAARYTAMIRKLAVYRRKKKWKQWQRLHQRAGKFRAKMIAPNRRHSVRAPKRSSLANALRSKPRTYQRRFSAALQSKSGRKAMQRYRQFWGVLPVKVKSFNEQKLPFKPRALIGLGRTDRVYLSPTPKRKGAQYKPLKGRWSPYTDETGRRILLLSGKQIRGQFKPVGFAPETWYTPSPALEQAGTHKAGKIWRHKHSDGGGSWPTVYADRNGKVDANSNFVYGHGTYRVTDWIHR